MNNVLQLRKSFDHLEQLQAKIEQLAQGGGGGDNGGMESRIAKLESAAEFIQRDMSDLKTEVRGLRSDAKTDFRTLFGALIVVALGLAGLMAKGFGWL